MKRNSNVRIVRIATIGVLGIVILGTALNGSGLFTSNVSADAKLRHIIMLLPSVFFIGAIWMVERAFHAIASGQAVECALAILMKRLGICLFLGGLSFVFLQPLLLRTLTAHYSAWAWFDVPAITLGSLGLMLFFMSGPLREAGVARAELEEIL